MVVVIFIDICIIPYIKYEQNLPNRKKNPTVLINEEYEPGIHFSMLNNKPAVHFLLRQENL